MCASLRARLWASYGLMIAVALGVVAAFLVIYLIRSPFLYRQTLERIGAVQALIEVSGRRPGDIPPVRLDDLAARFSVRIIEFGTDGTVLLDTAKDSPGIPFPRSPRTDGGGRTVRDSTGRPWLYSVREQTGGGWLLVAARKPRLSLLVLLAEGVLPLLAAGGLTALVLSLGAAYLLSRWIADPVERIISGAEATPPRPAAGDPSAGPPEVQKLTRAYNDMLARIQAAQKSQRNFVADVSHELKTPLTAIQGFAQAILDETAATGAQRRRAADVIHAEALRMQLLVSDLLDLARLESQTAELGRDRVDLCDVLRAAEARFQALAAQRKITLAIQVADGPIFVVGDADKLVQAFSNLLDNAIRHTGPGGLVAAALQRPSEATFIELSVTDNGEGIEAEDLPHVFDRFFQADRARKRSDGGGAGLGLAIAREIIEAHDGRITVRSHPGQGSTFTIRFPTAPTLPAAG